jgi:ABC-type dipeptide/oligopeptide/nickel transport system permease component
VAILLLLSLASGRGVSWFPLQGLVSPGFDALGPVRQTLDLLWHLVLPVAGARSWKYLVLPSLTLGLVVSAVLARITRASMLEALNQDYVRTARAKGLREVVVVYRHALRNALIPVVTIVGLLIGSLLSGAFIIEAVFGYPGLGLLAVNALQTRDFPLIQGIVLLVATIYVVVNVLVDIMYGLIDPRIKFS